MSASTAAAGGGDPLSMFHPPVAEAAPPSSSAVQVAVRIRPLNAREVSGQSLVCTSVDRNTGVLTLFPPTARVSRRSALTQAVRHSASSSAADRHEFRFDHVFDDALGNNEQVHVFEALGTTILDNAFEGPCSTHLSP